MRTPTLSKSLLGLALLLANSTQAVEVQYTNLSSLSESHQKKVQSWIDNGLKSTFKTLGPLKQPVLPVFLQPRYFAIEPVPWASVKRGRFDGIELHFHRYASESSLIKDWTLYHELSHLYHPLFDYEYFWLSEGLATYLQNIIMLDNGIIDYSEFKQRLRAGLKRGRLQSYSIKGPLSEVANDMWQLGAQQRVYWSGAAFFIEAELALKQQTGPYKSIAQLIKQYQQCCKQANHTAKQFLTTLDKLSKSAIFSSLFNTYAMRQDFPVITQTQLNRLRF
ncbi:hypothetical protein [Pseudoalteromonas sp. MMG022]|uniref:hypothetical protein n=1 Tax=Pseudoalteromonas sp. MMG022 TaxID=2909978 RepID=UPI001F25B7ED|nr:hypothetical protein [Pseudoalteromonas sp. MMG022]MCF6434021.1 hypothetical protein [Pseudoalteromonas sp. MMG022]